MQDRYADDFGQFLKLGLLRWLASPSPFGHGHRLGVIWVPAPSERDLIDGEQVAPLDPSSAAGQDLRSLDPELSDRLRLMVAESGRPLSVRESCGALPTGTVCFDRSQRFDALMRSDRAARVVSRQRWFHEAMVAVDPCSLVFLDSDNGLVEDDSQQPWRDRADDDVSMSEVAQLLEREQSVVTHQLVDPTQALPALVKARMTDIHGTLGIEPLAVVRGSRACTRLFTIIPHRRHQSDLHDRIGALQLSRWGDEFRVYRWRRELVTA